MKKLRGLISEATFKTKQDLAQHIANARGSDITDEDLIDHETGEVFLAAGSRYDSSDLHPQYVRQSKNRFYLSDQEVESLSSSEDLPSDSFTSETAFEKLEDYVKEFILNFEGDPDLTIADVPDIAESFFVSYEDWKELSVATGMSRREIKDFVSDMIVDALS